jgi:hypothetical protein
VELNRVLLLLFPFLALLFPLILLLLWGAVMMFSGCTGDFSSCVASPLECRDVRQHMLHTITPGLLTNVQCSHIQDLRGAGTDALLLALLPEDSETKSALPPASDSPVKKSSSSSSESSSSVEVAPAEDPCRTREFLDEALLECGLGMISVLRLRAFRYLSLLPELLFDFWLVLLGDKGR